ncbi:MAG: hypothetical protein D6737_06240 [Chloroflexi bacterium]|nr:MAG: hypothetical protein CUN54_00950 [Phototrophicales bacterium]RMF81038.1 MAG: hypothetical protein D6737_06240 [Chloroflexota bacterium]
MGWIGQGILDRNRTNFFASFAPLRFNIFCLRGIRIFSVIVLLFIFVMPASAQSENIFGVVEGFWLPDEVCELHPGWERIIFDWAQHQPTGPDDWHTLNVDDRWLKAANDCNREVVALLKHTPQWATDGSVNIGVPRGLYLPVDDPDNLWANFVRRAAEYYDSRGVNHFIIWNEPDITPDTYGYEFEGSLEDYYQLLRVGYLAAKQGNPNAVIHLAGTTYWHDVNAGRRLYVDRLLERIMDDPEAAANDYYFDVLSLHIYFRTDSVYDIVGQSQALLDSYGLGDKAIWINEMNAPPTEDPLWPVERPVYQLDLDQQSAFIVQAAGLGLAAGADHIAVYKFYDWNLPPGGETFGLLRADATRRPAFAAWQMVINYLDGVEQAALAQNETVDVVRLQHSNGRQTLLAWARSDGSSEIQVSATAEKAYLLDQYGNITIMRPAEGVYTLPLAGADCNDIDGCPVGGPVWLLIQPPGEFTVEETTASGSRPLLFE